MRPRESTRIGFAILAALAGTVASLFLPLSWTAHIPLALEATSLLLLMSPVTFGVLLLAFGWLLVGPYRSPAQRLAAEGLAAPPPSPADAQHASAAKSPRRNSVTRASSWGR